MPGRKTGSRPGREVRVCVVCLCLHVPSALGLFSRTSSLLVWCISFQKCTYFAKGSNACRKTAVPGHSSGSSVSQNPATCPISLFRRFRRLNIAKLVCDLHASA